MSTNLDNNQTGSLPVTIASEQNQQQQLLNMSPVNRMFNGRSVFITGASGFIGRVLLEKLLRCYPGIKNVYILMRPKKDQQPYDRLHKQLLKIPIFDRIRSMKDGQQRLDKIVVVAGDIAEPRLGINDNDMTTMLNDETLSIVFHSAATIKFDEPLKVSVKLNLIATKAIIDLCKKLPNLISLCHVSTAYVNSHLRDNRLIEEMIYPMKETPEQLIQLADIMDQDLLQMLKSKLVDQRPNTYTYTKALAEHLIAQEANDLPVAIVRPSIVIAAWKEPMPGWIDNLNGPTGLVLAIGKGLMRSMYASRSCKADIIPVDIVVNTMIASAYYAAKTNNKLSNDNESRKVDLITMSEMTSINGEVVYDKSTIKRTTNDSTTSTNSTKSKTATNTNNSLPEPITINNIRAAAAADDDKSKGSITNNVTSNNQHGVGDGRNKMTNCQQHITNSKKLNALDNNNTSSEQTNNNCINYKPHIIHCTSGGTKPITWGQMEDTFFPIIRRYPSCQVLRYPHGSFKSNRYHDFITRIFVHYLPALIIDMLCVMLGKKRQLLSIYHKLHSATEALTHFVTHNYNFKSTNIKILEASLSDYDRQILYMNMDSLNWCDFWDKYVLGARRYVLKEADHTLDEARKSFAKAFYIELCLRAVLLILASLCCFPLVARLPSLVPARNAFEPWRLLGF